MIGEKAVWRRESCTCESRGRCTHARFSVIVTAEASPRLPPSLPPVLHLHRLALPNFTIVPPVVIGKKCIFPETNNALWGPVLLLGERERLGEVGFDTCSPLAFFSA